MTASLQQQEAINVAMSPMEARRGAGCSATMNNMRSDTAHAAPRRYPHTPLLATVTDIEASPPGREVFCLGRCP